jgi:hypothetical protein
MRCAGAASERAVRNAPRAVAAVTLAVGAAGALLALAAVPAYSQGFDGAGASAHWEPPYRPPEVVPPMTMPVQPVSPLQPIGAPQLSGPSLSPNGAEREGPEERPSPTGGGGRAEPGNLPPMPIQTAQPIPHHPIRQIDLVSDLVQRPPCPRRSRPDVEVADDGILATLGYELAHAGGSPQIALAAKGVNMAVNASVAGLNAAADDTNDNIEAHLLAIDSRIKELKNLIGEANEIKRSDPAEAERYRALYYTIIRVNLARDATMAVPQSEDNGEACQHDIANCARRVSNTFAFLKSGISGNHAVQMHVVKAAASSLVEETITSLVGKAVGGAFGKYGGRAVEETVREQVEFATLSRTLTHTQWRQSDRYLRLAARTLDEVGKNRIEQFWKSGVARVDAAYGQPLRQALSLREEDRGTCLDVEAYLAAPVHAAPATRSALGAQVAPLLAPALRQAEPAIAVLPLLPQAAILPAAVPIALPAGISVPPDPIRVESPAPVAQPYYNRREDEDERSGRWQARQNVEDVPPVRDEFAVERTQGVYAETRHSPTCEDISSCGQAVRIDITHVWPE